MAAHFPTSGKTRRDSYVQATDTASILQIEYSSSLLAVAQSTQENPSAIVTSVSESTASMRAPRRAVSDQINLFNAATDAQRVARTKLLGERSGGQADLDRGGLLSNAHWQLRHPMGSSHSIVQTWEEAAHQAQASTRSSYDDISRSLHASFASYDSEAIEEVRNQNEESLKAVLALLTQQLNTSSVQYFSTAANENNWSRCLLPLLNEAKQSSTKTTRMLIAEISDSFRGPLACLQLAKIFVSNKPSEADQEEVIIALMSRRASDESIISMQPESTLQAAHALLFLTLPRNDFS